MRFSLAQADLTLRACKLPAIATTISDQDLNENGSSAVLQEIEFLKVTNVDGGGPYLPPAASAIERHFATVKSMFIGKPQLSFEFVKLIILIRRGIALEQNVSLFLKLAEAEIDFLSGTLSTRWLISVVDTYADHGIPVQQATAAMIAALFNMVKLTETERLLVADSRYDRTKMESLDQCRQKIEIVTLWDGMDAYSIHTGDMPRNMLRRMRRIASKDKVLSKILETLLERALSGPTILSRLSKFNSTFLPEDWRTEP